MQSSRSNTAFTCALRTRIPPECGKEDSCSAVSLILVQDTAPEPIAWFHTPVRRCVAPLVGAWGAIDANGWRRGGCKIASGRCK